MPRAKFELMYPELKKNYIICTEFPLKNLKSEAKQAQQKIYMD